MSDEIKDMGTNLPTDENTVTVSGADTEHGTQMATDTEADEVTAEVLAEDNTDATEAEGGEGEEPTSLVDGGEMPDEAGDSYADDDLDGAIPDGEVTTVFAVDDDSIAAIPAEYTPGDDTEAPLADAATDEGADEYDGEGEELDAALPTEEAEESDKPAKDVYDPDHPRGIDAIFDFVELLIFSLVAVLLATTFIFRHSVVEGPSMENTLFGGEHLIISDLFYTPERGDIIVCEDYTTKLRKPIVKRVIALPGDRVEILVTGDVYVNGELLTEDYVYEDEDTLYNHVDVVVPEGEIFVMGDHRNLSTDSREIGTVDMDSVLGKVLFRFYPFSRFGKVE